jgi:uncharacterized membrane protein YgcG
MSGFEWFLLIVVVIVVPLVVAIAITLWTLEQARLRNRKNRAESNPTSEPVKRRATRSTTDGSTTAMVATDSTTHRSRDDGRDSDGTSNDGGDSSGGDSGGGDGGGGGDSSS